MAPVSKNALTRREFMRQSMAATLMLAGMPVVLQGSAGAVDIDNYVLPRGTLGNSGIKTTILGFGTGTSGSNYSSAQTRLGFDVLVDLLEYAYDRGIRFFDLAQQYGSHPHLGKALTTGGGTIPRDQIMIMTKINLDYNYSGAPYTDDQLLQDPVVYAREVLDTLRQQTGTDYFDLVLLHHMGIRSAVGDWVTKYQGVMDELSKQKQEGRIGALGVSQHGNSYGDLGPLQLARDTDWVEVDLVRFNPMDGKVYNRSSTYMDDTTANVTPILQQMKAKGKGIIGMKVFNMGYSNVAGGFTTEIKQSDLDFQFTQGLTDIFTIGMLSREQVDENIGLIAELVPRLPDEWRVI